MRTWGDGAHTLPVGTGNAAAAFQVSHEVKSTDISLDGFTRMKTHVRTQTPGETFRPESSEQPKRRSQANYEANWTTAAEQTTLSQRDEPLTRTALEAVTPHGRGDTERVPPREWHAVKAGLGPTAAAQGVPDTH